MLSNHNNIDYKKFYEELNLNKWERVLSEENINEEECKERISNNPNLLLGRNEIIRNNQNRR